MDVGRVAPDLVDTHDRGSLDGGPDPQTLDRQRYETDLGVHPGPVGGVGVTRAVVSEVGGGVGVVDTEIRGIDGGLLEILVVVVIEGGDTDVAAEVELVVEVETKVDDSVGLASRDLPAI